MRLARHLPVTTLAAAIAMSGHAQAQTEITVATVNNNVIVNEPATTERAAVRISLVPHLQYLGQDVSMEADVGLQLGSA